MDKTTVTLLSRHTYNELVSEYMCDECKAKFLDRYEEYGYCPYCGRKIVDATKVSNPICSEWHSNDVMPSGNKLCIFEIKVGKASKILIGYRQCDTIVRESSECEFVCFEDAVIRWCYIDLN